MYVKSLAGQQKQSNGTAGKKRREPVTGKRSTSAPSHNIQYGFYAPVKEYATPQAKKPNRNKGTRIAPWKIILSLIVVGGLGIAYLTHVFNTRQLLQEVNQLEQQNQKVERLNKEYRLQYQRLTGPSEIYDEAEQMSFIHGGPADQILTLQKD